MDRAARTELLMVHYNDLKKDLAGEMRRIAGFLDMDIPESLWPELVEGADFEYMRKNGATLMPRAATSWTKATSGFSTRAPMAAGRRR